MSPEDLLAGGMLGAEIFDDSSLFEALGDEDDLERVHEVGSARLDGSDPLIQTSYSGSQLVPTSGREVPLGRWFCKRNNGLASVHVNVVDDGAFEEVDGANARLTLLVTWKTGMGGGFALVDATRGTQFTIAGADHVDLRAIQESGEAVGGTAVAAALVAQVAKRVEASVHWGTSFNPKPAYRTLLTQTITAAAATGSHQVIPSQARGMIAWTDVVAAYAGMTARFTRNSIAGGSAANTVALVPAPFTNGMPIAHGAERVQMGVTVDARVTPCFELWL